MKRLLIALLFISCQVWFSVAQAQAVSTPLKAGRTAEGVTYFLPKTAIRFNLLIEKKTYTPGEYAKYAEKYLGMTGIEQEEQITYSVASYNISQIGVRDTSKCYTVELKGKREYRGVLDGYDPYMNLVLKNAEERYDGNTVRKLSTVIVRGDNVIYISP